MYYHDDPTYDTPTSSIVPVQQNPVALSHRTRRAMIISLEHENARAVLAKTGMENTNTLCQIGEQLCESTPSSREYVGTILRAYTYATSKRVLEW